MAPPNLARLNYKATCLMASWDKQKGSSLSTSSLQAKSNSGLSREGTSLLITRNIVNVTTFQLQSCPSSSSLVLFMAQIPPSVRKLSGGGFCIAKIMVAPLCNAQRSALCCTFVSAWSTGNLQSPDCLGAAQTDGPSLTSLLYFQLKCGNRKLSQQNSSLSRNVKWHKQPFRNPLYCCLVT